MGLLNAEHQHAHSAPIWPWLLQSVKRTRGKTTETIQSKEDLVRHGRRRHDRSPGCERRGRQVTMRKGDRETNRTGGRQSRAVAETSPSPRRQVTNTASGKGTSIQHLLNDGLVDERSRRSRVQQSDAGVLLSCSWATVQFDAGGVLVAVHQKRASDQIRAMFQQRSRKRTRGGQGDV